MFRRNRVRAPKVRVATRGVRGSDPGAGGVAGGEGGRGAAALDDERRGRRGRGRRGGGDREGAQACG